MRGAGNCRDPRDLPARSRRQLPTPSPGGLESERFRAGRHVTRAGPAPPRAVAPPPGRAPGSPAVSVRSRSPALWSPQGDSGQLLAQVFPFVKAADGTVQRECIVNVRAFCKPFKEIVSRMMSETITKWTRPHGHLSCTGNPREAWNVSLDDLFTSSRKVAQESSSNSPGDHFIAEETKLREAKLMILLVSDGMGVCM